MVDATPGTWSTDEYIREWARCRGLDAQPECVVPLQSVQQHWLARIRFGEKGDPVERFVQDEAAGVNGIRSGTQDGAGSDRLSA